MQLVIVRTGAANLASVTAAFARLGMTSTITEDPEQIESAPLVVLPGVGAFGPAMQYLTSRGIDRALVSRFDEGRPLLAICLGFQLLCETSEESPGIRGLSLFSSSITRFQNAPRVPHMGWNSIEPTTGTTILTSGIAYFANSYRLSQIPVGWSGAVTDYAGPFASALERGTTLACQFHPELSGTFGRTLLTRWLARCQEPIAC